MSRVSPLACRIFFLLLAWCIIGLAPAHAAQWLRGDLHAHSTYSDGDSTVARMVAEAERLGFDYFVLTDHDSVQKGVPGQWSDPAYVSEKLVLLYGMEWTTALGHANVWAAAPFEYAPVWDARQNRDPAAALAAAHDAGALFSINHPEETLVTRWNYPVPEETDSVEVWNAFWRLPGQNHMAVHTFWDGLLLSGRHITGVGGSDTHQLKHWMSILYDLGMPTTWVWAEDKSAASILEGIRQGHAAISFSVDSPRIELAADGDNDTQFETRMGDSIAVAGESSVRMKLEITAVAPQTAGRAGSACELAPVAVRALAGGKAVAVAPPPGAERIRGLPAYVALVYKNGRLDRAWSVRGEASILFSAQAKPGDYFRAELAGLPRMPVPLRVLYGYMVALTNPIYMAGP